MAGRSYHLSAASRQKPYVSNENHIKNIHKKQDDLDNDEFADDDAALHPGFRMWILIVAFAAMLTSLVVYLVAIYVYDFGNGASSSSELAMNVSVSLDNFDYQAIEAYIPKPVRDFGFVPDTDEFSRFRTWLEEYGYKLRDAVIESDEPFDDIEALQDGFSNMYGRSVAVSAARMVRVRLLFYNSDHDDINITVKMIVVKVHTKWYLYTGSSVESENEEILFFSFSGDNSDHTGSVISDISYVEKLGMSETETDMRDLPELDFYDAALSDLLSGSCVINGKVHTMPDSFASFSDMFVLDEERMPFAATDVLKQDETIGNVPVKFVDEESKDIPVYVTLGNLSSEDISVSNANITTFYVGSNGVFADVILPGNVTFGTSYDDVIRMYGSFDRAESDSMFRGCLSDMVYSFSLGNSRQNKIYFGFKDGKLLEIQWYYIDMTDYREI